MSMTRQKCTAGRVGQFVVVVDDDDDDVAEYDDDDDDEENDIGDDGDNGDDGGCGDGDRRSGATEDDDKTSAYCLGTGQAITSIRIVSSLNCF